MLWVNIGEGKNKERKGRKRKEEHTKQMKMAGTQACAPAGGGSAGSCLSAGLVLSFL